MTSKEALIYNSALDPFPIFCIAARSPACFADRSHDLCPLFVVCKRCKSKIKT